MIHSKPPLDVSRCRKLILTISNGADDVIGTSGALPCLCGFFCFTHGH